MTDIDVPAAPVAPVRTPLGVARGVLKTMRPRQWVKNILVFAAPFVGGRPAHPGHRPQAADRLRRVLARRVGDLPGQRREGRRGGPRAPDQAVPADRRRHRRAPPRDRRCRRAARRVGGGEPARVGAARGRAGRVRGGAAGVLLLAQAPGRAGIVDRRQRLHGARDRRRRGSRRRAVAVVPGRHLVRLAVHGRRQASRRKGCSTAATSRPARRSRTTRSTTCSSSSR